MRNSELLMKCVRNNLNLKTIYNQKRHLEWGKKNEMMAPVVQAPMPQTFLSFCSDSKQDAGQTGADRKKKMARKCIKCGGSRRRRAKWRTGSGHCVTAVKMRVTTGIIVSILDFTDWFPVKVFYLNQTPAHHVFLLKQHR